MLETFNMPLAFNFLIPAFFRFLNTSLCLFIWIIYYVILAWRILEAVIYACIGVLGVEC